MEFTLQQNIIGLYALMPRDNIKIEIRKLHEWFYEQKQENPDIFGSLRFDWDGRHPTCKNIDYIHSTLRTIGFLKRDFFEKNSYTISDSCRDYFERKMKPFTDKPKTDKIKRLSKSLFDALS